MNITLLYTFLRGSSPSRGDNNRAARETRDRAFPLATASPNPRDNANESSGQSGLCLPSQPQSAYHQAIRSPLDQPSYIGEQSLMSSSSSASTYVMLNAGSFPEHIHNEILRVTNATSLPPPSKVQVFVDTYFKHLYHIAPVIDRTDLAVLFDFLPATGVAELR